MSEPAWARDFFTGLFVDLWLQVPTATQTAAEVDFLEKVLRLHAGSRILDVPCGGGRHALELAARGYEATGLDLSPEFLAAARTSSAQRGLPVTWLSGSMLNIPVDQPFDAAFCLGNSLGGLDDAETALFFENVFRALGPGGRFVVDTGAIAEGLLLNVKDHFWMPVGDILFLVANSYDVAQSRLNIQLTLIRGSQQERKSAFQRVFMYREFCALASQAGFQDIEGFCSLNCEPFKLGSRVLYLCGTKPLTA